MIGDESDVLRALQRHAVFSSCGEEVLRRFVSSSTHHVATRGSRIATAVTRFPYLCLVCSGVLSVVVSSDGPTRGVRRLQAYEVRPGEILGELAFLENAPPPGDIVVVSKRASYVLFPAQAVEAALRQEPNLVRALGVHAARRARSLAQRLVAPQGFTAASRVASVLLQFASDADGLQPAQPELAEITQRDIAAAAWCVKESAARAISALEALGALRREHGHIRYLDRNVLAAHAEGSRDS